MQKIRSGAGFSRLPWKALLLIQMCYWCNGIPLAKAVDTISTLVPADYIPPPDILIPQPDAITPYVGAGITYDSNVLRLRDTAAANAMGLGGMSDTIRHAEFGLALDTMISRQHLTANVNVNQVNYDRFAALDHLDKNASANWNWFAGEHVQGNVGVNYSQGLTPFIDFHLLAPNIRSQASEYADASWLFDPSWRVRGGLTHTQLWYDLASQQPGNNTQNQTELGLDYLARSGSTIGLQARHISADFPIPEQDNGTSVFNGYEQNELKAKVDWIVTGKTRLHFLGGWVSRKQDQISARDFSGINTRFAADWSPTGKIDVSAAIWREIGAVDDLSTIYSLNRGASLASTWKYSAKINLIAQVNYVKRDFSQSTAGGVFGGSSAENDVLRNEGLTMVYNPTDKWEVRLSAVRSMQTANVLTGGYTSNALMLNTRYAF
jgi:exopolysaccharide biosynthesis operon protein EpsL